MGSIVSQPNVSVTLASADLAVQNTAQKVLIVGQMTSGTSAGAGELVQNIGGDGAEDTLFGASSQLAGMIRAFKSVAPIVRVDAIALDDAAGTARVVTLAFTAGPATTAATYTVVVGSEADHKYLIAVAVGDTITEIGDAVEAAVNADGDCPFTANNTAGSVAFTADNDGTIANDLGVKITGSVGAVTHNLTDTTPGATNPTLTGALTVIGSERYQGVVWPYASDTDEVTDLLEARFNVDNNVLDGTAFSAYSGTHAECLTYLNTSPGPNLKSLVVFFDEQSDLDFDTTERRYIGPAVNAPGYVKAAQFAAVRALRLTPNASISQFITTSASLDQFGGPALASLPYFNTTLPDLSTVEDNLGWTDTELEQLLAAGGSIIGVNRGGDAALVGEVVSTYLTDAASNPDATWTFLNYIDTGSNIREYFWTNLKSRFAQSRLTDGAVERSRAMANEDMIRAYYEKLYQDLSEPGYVLTRSGEENFVYFKENLTVSLDLVTGLVTSTALVPIVTQTRRINLTLKIAFSTAGG